MAYVSSRVYAGQTTGITTTAVPAASGAIGGSNGVPNCRECIIQSDPANTTNMLIGSSLNQYVTLTPGQAITIPIMNPELLYVKMASGTGTANWISRD